MWFWPKKHKSPEEWNAQESLQGYIADLKGLREKFESIPIEQGSTSEERKNQAAVLKAAANLPPGENENALAENLATSRERQLLFMLIKAHRELMRHEAEIRRQEEFLKDAREFLEKVGKYT